MEPVALDEEPVTPASISEWSQYEIAYVGKNDDVCDILIDTQDN